MKKIIITLLVALFTVLSSNYIYAEDEYTFTWIHADERGQYTKIEEVIDYINHPDTDNKVRHIVEIILTSDVDLKKADTLLIHSGTSVEIDLNGYNFTNSLLKEDQPLFTNEGVLVIKDTNTGEGVVSIDNSNSTAPIVLNKGIFDLESGTLKHVSNTVIVNGEDGLKDSAEIYINDGLITTSSDYAIIQHGFSYDYDSSIRINGGKFESNKYVITTEKADNNYETSIYIDGGEFNRALNVTSTNCVRNASFKEEPKSSLCADNFYVTQDGDNFVVTTDYVARIGNTYYKNLTDAFNKAKLQETITILKDFNEYSDFYLTHDVDFDLNGHNINVHIFITSGNFFDSSEIINVEKQYYCRPQGSIGTTSVVEKNKNKIENGFDVILINGLNYSNEKKAFPVFNNGVYKFYTLTGYEFNLKAEKDFRFSPIIGFRANSVWKEILSPSSNIEIGFKMTVGSIDVYFSTSKGVVYGDANSSDKYKVYALFDDANIEKFTSNNGMGTFMVTTSYNPDTEERVSVTPIIYDTKNKTLFISTEKIVSIFNKKETKQ